jgi:hypothetical protein
MESFMTASSRLPRIILPDDPERYRGLPPSEQQRLLEKKRRALKARGIPIPQSFMVAAGDKSTAWRMLPLLDDLLKCPACSERPTKRLKPKGIIPPGSGPPVGHRKTETLPALPEKRPRRR